MDAGRGSRGRGRGASRGGGRGGRAGRGSSHSETRRDDSNRPSSGGGDSDNKHKRSSDGGGRGKGNHQAGRGGRGRGRGSGRGSNGRGGGRGYKGNAAKGSAGSGGGGGDGGEADDGLPANKKRRLKIERQQHRPEFDTVTRSKQIWNKLRDRKVPSDERARLVHELLEIIKGKVLSIAMKHDASRVVQTALQFGTREERLSLFSEMEGHLVELSQLTYSHHIVQRLFKDIKGAEEQKRLAKTFRGHTVRLATHAIGAEVVQTALSSLPMASATLIKSEFYGKEFALFDDGGQPHSLKAVLESRPDRRGVVMEHVHGVIVKLVAKSLMKFQFAHELLWEYFQEASPVQMQELVPQLVESYMILLSTRPGSMAAAMCAAHGGAKERKRMMRSLKGVVANALLHRDSYLAVMRLIESVDDTITCQKTILAELLKPLQGAPEDAKGSVPKPAKGSSAEEWVPRGTTGPQGNPADGVSDGGGGDGGVTSMEVDEEEGEEGMKEPEGKAVAEDSGAAPPAMLAVMKSRTGCKILLRLLAPEHTGYLHPEELDLLKPTMVPAPASKMAGAENGAAKEGTPTLVPSSKKEASVRRRELLAYLREPLREVCASHAGDLMRSKFAGDLVLQEAIRAIGTPQVVQAVAEAACAKPLEMQLPMYEDPAGHLFMKQLLKREAEAQQAAATGDDSGAAASTSWFADALLQHAGGALATWAGSNRGAFVVSALEQVPSTSAGVRKAFETNAARAKLVKDAKAGSTMGVKVLAEQLGFGDFGAKEAAAKIEAAHAKRNALKKKV